MSNVLRVQWTITPQIAPRPWLTCNRCGGARAFRSSDKIRINANGKRVDAWLIYKCVDCENSWNRPLFERRHIRDIDPAFLQALQTNDPDWARRAAFDVEDLKRRSERVEEFAAVDVRKLALSEGSEPLERIEIALAVPMPTCLRVDRLLASEFRMSRVRVQELQANGRLAISPQGARMLRRPVRDRMGVSIEILPKDDDVDFVRSARGP
ncbi:DUF1062 domain-containing protein [Methylocapsa sp. S129]|uniref:DUF1062 domain-containing protein n=1 Tax=Methylocapsa sp. S129 TaxID=1641869 RepID=UPI00131A843C|nr:DUF1062 domain-containing protein [Methylocapsa sp. S129]